MEGLIFGILRYFIEGTRFQSTKSLTGLNHQKLTLHMPASVDEILCIPVYYG